MFKSFSIDIIDPMNRTGKITVPVEHVVDTRGLREYCDSVASNTPKDFSLCLLYQRGSCRGGARCHQIHAAPSFVEALRAKARATRTCCAQHGDVHSDSFAKATTVVTVQHEVEEERYTLSSFGRTAALDNALRVHHRTGNPIRVTGTRLCRLHLQSRCKFGKDCKNFHLCPEAKEVVAEKRSPSIDACTADLCGVSTVGSLTPRDQDVSVEEITVAPLTLWSKAEGTPLELEECSGFGFEVSEEFSSRLDLSAFETTMQMLCEDLDRADFSPNTAVRVRSNCNLLSLRE